MIIIRENIGIAIIALIVALLIKSYVWIIDPPTSVELVNIHVQPKNIPVGLSVSRIIPDRIELELDGPKSKIETLRNRDLTAIADLHGIAEEGEYQVRIRLSQSRFQGVRSQIHPDTVMVIVGRYQKKFFSPEEIISGDFIGNRKISKIDGLPDTIEVSGSLTSLKNVQKIVYEIDVNHPGDSFSQEVKFNVISNEDKIITNLKVDPESVEIKVHLCEHTINQTLPVVLNISGTPASDYSIESQDISPLYVEVSGAPDILRELSRIETERISISGRKSGINREINLIAPNPEITLNPETVRVKVVITQVAARREIKDIMIEVRRKKDGYKYSLETSTVDVLIQGPMSKMNKLDLNLIKPSVDVSAIQAGRHTVKLNAGLPSGVSLISINPAEVVLIVEKAEETPPPTPVEAPE